MKRVAHRLAIGVTTALVAGVVGWWWLHEPRKPAGSTVAGLENRTKGTPGSVAPSSATATAPAATGANQPSASSLQSNLLNRLRGDLAPGRPAASRSRLAAVRNQLRALPPGAAAGQLLDFLRAGVDVDTGLRLRVGRGGWLEEAPTLRVAALDWLAEFDPTAAFDNARQIFADSNSADEWALALRNYYRKTQTADAYFEARVAEALSRPGWLQQPTAGLAESVDFPVAIGGVDGYGLLKTLLQQSAALRRPALAALDAWVVEDRHTAIALLAAEAGEPGGVDAGSRAALLSRADLRDEAQRAAVESYLESKDVPREAKAEFLRQFPNHNMILGNHLVTTTNLAPLEESVALDVAASQFIDRMVGASALPDLGQELAACRERLAQYLASARRGGKL
jgi:hypothetical protein